MPVFYPRRSGGGNAVWASNLWSLCHHGDDECAGPRSRGPGRVAFRRRKNAGLAVIARPRALVGM